MKRFGIIGYPVAHSRSPLLFREAYGGRYAYDLIETPSFEEAWKRFIEGYDAVNVTMPFKTQAALRADSLSEEVKSTGAANILVKTGEGIAAYNSDYLGVLSILQDLFRGQCPPPESCAIIGYGGAGRAAEAAAKACGLKTAVLRHDGLASGVTADIVIYTLPKAVEGIGRIECRFLVEANYKDPCLENGGKYVYIPGKEWLRRQAETGYALMTGEQPEFR